MQSEDNSPSNEEEAELPLSGGPADESGLSVDQDAINGESQGRDAIPLGDIMGLSLATDEGASEGSTIVPIFSGPGMIMWAGVGSVILIMVLIFVLMVRGRAHRANQTEARTQFFEPAGDDVDIEFDDSPRRHENKKRPDKAQDDSGFGEAEADVEVIAEEPISDGNKRRKRSKRNSPITNRSAFSDTFDREDQRKRSPNATNENNGKRNTRRNKNRLEQERDVPFLLTDDQQQDNWLREEHRNQQRERKAERAARREELRLEKARINETRREQVRLEEARLEEVRHQRMMEEQQAQEQAASERLAREREDLFRAQEENEQALQEKAERERAELAAEHEAARQEQEQREHKLEILAAKVDEQTRSLNIASEELARANGEQEATINQRLDGAVQYLTDVIEQRMPTSDAIAASLGSLNLTQGNNSDREILLQTLTGLEQALEAQSEGLKSETRELLAELARFLQKHLEDLGQAIIESNENKAVSGSDDVTLVLTEKFDQFLKRSSNYERRLERIMERFDERIARVENTAYLSGVDASPMLTPQAHIEALQNEVRYLRSEIGAITLSSSPVGTAARQDDNTALKAGLAANKRKHRPPFRLSDLMREIAPSAGYKMNVWLSNDRQADCLVNLPMPCKPVAIDAKFPLEAFQELGMSEAAKAQFRRIALQHLLAVAEDLVSPEETNDTAFMLIASETLFTDFVDRFPDIVQDALRYRVQIVSPSNIRAALALLEKEPVEKAQPDATQFNSDQSLHDQSNDGYDEEYDDFDEIEGLREDEQYLDRDGHYDDAADHYQDQRKGFSVKSPSQSDRGGEPDCASDTEMTNFDDGRNRYLFGKNGDDIETSQASKDLNGNHDDWLRTDRHSSLRSNRLFGGPSDNDINNDELEDDQFSQDHSDDEPLR
ncbi:MAG: DNA recombination protein RmuC [Pseudomonadota bacterium]